MHKLGEQGRYWLLLLLCIVAGLCSVALRYCSLQVSTVQSEYKVPDGDHPVYQHARYVDSILDSIHRPVDVRGVKQERVVGVGKLGEVFNDLNPEQLATAERLGIPPISNRAEFGEVLSGLQDISNLEGLHISKQMTHSIPYLIPRAYRLIQSLSSSFQDSLKVKGYSPKYLIVTSVLRTEEDLHKLRRSNGNASPNSCHRYGTTFDISYRRFYDPIGQVDIEDERLKLILAEVLRDYHTKELCYVKYEYKQACFHITAR